MDSRRAPINPVVAARLENARREFEQWRQSRTNRSRVPASLWNLASEVAKECGACRTARELHINYGKLRKYLEPGKSRLGQSKPAAASFVEIVPAPAVRFSECTVEIDRGKGTKIRIHLRSPEPPDLAAIGNALLMVRR